MTVVDQSRDVADHLAERLEFEVLIAEVSASLVAVLPARLAEAVEAALARVREFFRADRCAILSIGDDGEQAHVHRASYAPGVPEVSVETDLAQELPWARHLLVDRVPMCVARIDDLPPDANVDRAKWTSLPIRSALAVPVETAGAVRHAIVLQTAFAEREWPEAFVPRLRLLGEMLVGALQRQALVDDLRMSEERLASGADLAGLAFYEVDFARGEMYMDERLRDVCGMPADIDAGLAPLAFWMAHVHPDDLADVLESRDELHFGRIDRLSIEYRYGHPSRGERWIQHEGRVAKRNDEGYPVKTFGVLRDITDQKRVEQDLRDLSRQLIHAHEQERALLARELHDDVTQRLAVLAIDVSRVELSLAGRPEGDALRTARLDVVRLSEDIHSLAYHLHPSVLEELGLLEALRAEAERWGRHGRLDVSLALDALPDAFGKTESLCLFRIAQEALNNVVRHAGVDAASVRLRPVNDGVLLAVHDEGAGFDTASRSRTRSLGLIGMRERVRLVNGTLDVDSTPGRGTTVVAWVPWNGAGG